MTLLKRLGNKDQIADKIIKYFPPHKYYIEMFFGAGGVFFNKPKAKFSILNDINSDVFNLHKVVLDRSEELKDEIENTPISLDMFKYWSKNEIINDPVLKAVRFLILSYFGFNGNYNGMAIYINNHTKRLMLNRVEPIKMLLTDTTILNYDFRNILNSIRLDDRVGLGDTKQTFIYADPPYINTTNNYNIDKWTEQDTIDLFDILVNSGIRFAISERDDPFILDLAKQHNLDVIHIMSKRALSGRHNEILIVNYEPFRQLNLFE